MREGVEVTVGFLGRWLGGEESRMVGFDVGGGRIVTAIVGIVDVVKSVVVQVSMG